MIEWTDIGDGFKAWVVNDRPVLVMDTQAKNGKDSPHTGKFRHIDAALFIEQQMGWRVEMVKVSPQICAVVKLSKIHELGYSEVKNISTGDYAQDEPLHGLLELAGLASYSSQYRLREAWNGHPPGSLLIWKSGYGKQPGVGAVIEKRGLESILAMVLEQGGLLP